MGIALSIGEIGEVIAGIIAGGEEAGAAAGAVEAGLTPEETAAAEEAAKDVIESGGSSQAAARAAVEAVGRHVAGFELSEIGDLISTLTGFPGGQIAGDAIASATGIETIGDISTYLSDLISEGFISEEVGIELTELPNITSEEIEELGVSQAEFEHFEIEASEEFEQLNDEGRQMWNKLKQLGNKVIDRVKQAVLSCRKSALSTLTCAATLYEVIKGLYKEFFNEKSINPNVMPTFSGVDPYAVGSTVAELTAMGIGVYYDELVKNPSIAKDERAIDNLILKAFKGIENELHSTMSRSIYKMIRSSKFIKGEEVQKKFDDIYKVYDGRFQSFPYREKRSNLVTYVDETGQKISYKGDEHPNSVTTFLGYWCGPLSYNNSPVLWEGREPEPGKVARYSGTGLLDSFCFAHDCDYDFRSTGDIGRGGWFNQIGDFILVSRILHTQHLMEYKERSLALMTVAWFSTLGTILNTYLHPLIVNFDVRDPVRTFESDEANDLYSILFPKKAKKQNYENKIVLTGTNTPSNEDTQRERRLFYQGMHDKLREKQTDFLVRNGYAFKEKDMSSLLLFFDNLKVVKLN